VMSLAVAGFAAGAASAWLAPVAPAAPYFERISGTQCMVKSPNVINYNYASIQSPPSVRATTNATIDLLCPVPDKTALPATQITSIQVYGHDQKGAGNTTESSVYQLSARACSVAANGTATCSSVRYTSSVGYQTITLDGGYLNSLDTHATPYLYVTVPGGDMGLSSLIGVYFYKSS
jgi:hypothetical protein